MAHCAQSLYGMMAHCVYQCLCDLVVLLHYDIDNAGPILEEERSHYYWITRHVSPDGASSTIFDIIVVGTNYHI